MKLVTLLQAKKLKELGYAYVSGEKRYYHKDGKLVIYDHWDYYNDCSDDPLDSDIYAPTISEALDWLREVKGIVAEIKVSKYTKPLEYMFRIYEYCADLRSYESHSHELGFSTHSLAESALLDEVIKHLEKTKI